MNPLLKILQETLISWDTSETSDDSTDNIINANKISEKLSNVYKISVYENALNDPISQSLLERERLDWGSHDDDFGYWYMNWDDADRLDEYFKEQFKYLSDNMDSLLEGLMSFCKINKPFSEFMEKYRFELFVFLFVCRYLYIDFTDELYNGISYKGKLIDFPHLIEGNWLIWDFCKFFQSLNSPRRASEDCEYFIYDTYDIEYPSNIMLIDFYPEEEEYDLPMSQTKFEKGTINLNEKTIRNYIKTLK